MAAVRSLIAGLVVAGALVAPPTTTSAASYLRRGASPGVLPEVPVTAMNLGVGWANNSPQIAGHPAKPALLVVANRTDGPTSGCPLHISGDGSRRWAPLRPVATLPKGASACYAPEVAFDRAGRLYFLFVGLKVPGNSPIGVFLVTSEDNGGHFSAPRRVLGKSSYQAHLAVDARAVDHGRVWLVWLAASSDGPPGGFPAGPNPLLAKFSDDGGKRFSSPRRLSDPDRPRAVAPAVAVGADHRLVVAYFDLRDDVRDYLGLEGPAHEGTWSVVVTRSARDAKGFEKAAVVSDKVVPPGRPPLIYTMAPPSLALGAGGRVYVGWADSGHGDADVLVARSGDGGRHFATPVRVNDDPVANGNPQYLPALGVAPDGRVDVAFFDRRRDLARHFHDIYFADSVDGARTFTPNQRLTSEASNPLIGQRWAVPSGKGQAELGSRLGLLSDVDGAVVAWPDTRNTVGSADEVGGPIAQDVFSTKARPVRAAAHRRGAP